MVVSRPISSSLITLALTHSMHGPCMGVNTRHICGMGACVVADQRSGADGTGAATQTVSVSLSTLAIIHSRNAWGIGACVSVKHGIHGASGRACQRANECGADGTRAATHTIRSLLSTPALIHSTHGAKGRACHLTTEAMRIAIGLPLGQ